MFRLKGGTKLIFQLELLKFVSINTILAFIIGRSIKSF